MNFKLTHTDTVSRIEHEEFFPLRIVYDSDITDIRHIGFYHTDEDLLELSVDQRSGKIMSLQITICHHYSFTDNAFDLDNIVFSNEEVAVQLSDHIECKHFQMDVYNNCVVINVTALEPSQYIKIGRILFGIDDSKNIISFIVTGLTPEDIDHLSNELSLQ